MKVTKDYITIFKVGENVEIPDHFPMGFVSGRGKVVSRFLNKELQIGEKVKAEWYEYYVELTRIDTQNNPARDFKYQIGDRILLRHFEMDEILPIEKKIARQAKIFSKQRIVPDTVWLSKEAYNLLDIGEAKKCFNMTIKLVKCGGDYVSVGRGCESHTRTAKSGTFINRIQYSR